MRRTNCVLLGAVAALAVASAAAYRAGVGRAERFERGQKFLPNLNLDDAATIVIARGLAATPPATASAVASRVTLHRQGERFNVAEAHDYPADNLAVNRLLRELLEVALEKEVGAGPELEQAAGIDPPAVAAVEVSLADGAGREMVRFRLGKRAGERAGHYLQRRGPTRGPVYLTASPVSLATEAKDYLRKEVLDVPEERVRRVKGPDFIAERPAGASSLALRGASGGATDATALNRLAAVLRQLSFEQVYLADDPVVRDLVFEPTLRVILDDASGYQLATAARGEKTYLQLSAFHTVERLAFSVDTPETELVATARVLERADEIKDFNREQASWVYELAGFSAGRLALRRADLLKKTS